MNLSADSAVPPPEGRWHGTWIITYCDLVTILLACFLCILTFVNRQSPGTKRAGQPLAPLLEGGGAGVFSNGSDGGVAAVWRMRLLTAEKHGNSEAAPLHTDPSHEPADQILHALDDPAVGTLRDSYRLPIPLDMLITAGGQVSEAGRQTLDVLARNVRPFPYDVQLLVEERAHLPKGVAVATYFASEGGIHPGRVAVGVRSGQPSGKALLWLVFFRNS